MLLYIIGDNMKNKNAFTLVELLAVIAILAILVIIALPNVMGMFNTAKKNSFTTEVKELYKMAQQAWINDSLFNTADKEYGRCDGCSFKQLDLTGRQELKYYIKMNKSGNVIKFTADDGTYRFSYSGTGLIITDITDNLINTSNGESVVESSNNYSYYTDLNEIHIGDNISGINVSSTPVKNAFIKVEVDNNIITDYSLGFRLNGNNYYLKKGTSQQYYNENKEIIKNAFGESNCQEQVSNSFIKCLKDDIEVVLEANSYNRVGIYSEGLSCSNYSETHVDCSNVQ